MTPYRTARSHPIRRKLVGAAFLGMAAVLSVRAVYLQIIDKEFLQNRGENQLVRDLSIPAHRGMVTDRHGEPLAVSTPVFFVGGVPRELLEAKTEWPRLAKTLGMSVKELETRITAREGSYFTYLKRPVSPDVGERVAQAKFPGIRLDKEFHRYYPSSEVAAHIVGFSDIDDHGQEGIERAFDRLLRGEKGLKRVMRDNRNRIVGNVESIRAARPGQDLTLSIDRRIQYLTHQALAAAVRKHRAKAASMVVMDVTTGEVLAMANQPTYNPNNRKDLKSDRFRNRAVADVFEPGSTMKPFTVAAGLETGRFSPGTMIDTRPGQLTIGKYIVKDLHNCGVVNLATLIAKSSNVGATKIALAIGPDRVWQVLHGGGFGQSTQTGFPGELAGRLPSPRHLPPIAQATLSFGYGLSVTTLQLAQAYTMFATDGRVVPASFQPVSERPEGKRVISARTARAVRTMLEGVVTRGTGQAAHIPGYRVAGKTGTVHKTFGHGYAAHRYLSLFAGLVPVTNPRLVAVVMIDEPAGGVHFGGDVAAPVFAEVLTGAVRLMDIAPDDRDALPAAGPQPILTQADKGDPASAKDRVAQQ